MAIGISTPEHTAEGLPTAVRSWLQVQQWGDQNASWALWALGMYCSPFCLELGARHAWGQHDLPGRQILIKSWVNSQKCLAYALVSSITQCWLIFLAMNPCHNRSNVHIDPRTGSCLAYKSIPCHNGWSNLQIHPKTGSYQHKHSCHNSWSDLQIDPRTHRTRLKLEVTAFLRAVPRGQDPDLRLLLFWSAKSTGYCMSKLISALRKGETSSKLSLTPESCSSLSSRAHLNPQF